MLEDELRETFAAKAGSAPPESLASLHGAADVAILGAAKVRRRRRIAVAGLSGFVALAAASVAVLQTLTPGGPVGVQQADGPGQVHSEARPSLGAPSSRSEAPPAMRDVEAIGPSAQAATRVRFQLPATSTVSAAYQATDGYLVVNSQPDGEKQLVLQDDTTQPQVLVDDASNIAVARDGKTVAWAAGGHMSVGTRSGDDGKKDDNKKITKKNEADVPEDAQPVTFVGTSLVISSDAKGFDVWHTERKYNPTWDKSVVRVFGGTKDNNGVYAEVIATGSDAPMCLAQLRFDEPFTALYKVCGLPMAAEEGGRISPDRHWLAYPVEGGKQVAVVDLTTVFTGGVIKPKIWNLSVTTKTVWLNATTFVVYTGKKFLKLNPAGKADDSEPLDQEPSQDSADVVLIEPLEGQ